MIIFSQENIYNNTLGENISIEKLNLKKIKNILEKQKNIISKHYTNKVSKVSNDQSQILELQNLVTSFNTAFEKNNKSLQIINDLIEKLNSIDNIAFPNVSFIENEINFYNNFYNTNYPELIESIAFLTEFIQNLTSTSSGATSSLVQETVNATIPESNGFIDTELTTNSSACNSNLNIRANSQINKVVIDSVYETNINIDSDFEYFNVQNQSEQSKSLEPETGSNTCTSSSVVQAVTPKSEKKEIRKKLLVEIEKNEIDTTANSTPGTNNSAFTSSVSEGMSKQIICNDSNSNVSINNGLHDSKESLNNEPKDSIPLKNAESTVDKHATEKIVTEANNDSFSETTFATKVTSLPLQDNNTLRISEKDGSVYLPFKVSDLKQEFSKTNEKYDEIVDLVTTKYIVPITKYKNGVTSRFKEAYNLVSRKEKKSPFKAFEVGMEVAFNRSLHPAVISACKSLDQLDSYLDALDKKDLSKFNSFNIEFDSVPLDK